MGAEENASSKTSSPSPSISSETGSASSHCLVTVGTTNFDRLIKTLDTNARDFMNNLKCLGIETVTIQCGGTSKFVPDALQNMPNVRVVRTLSHLEFLDEVFWAGLIIGHAGAGTILEALSNQKRLLIVPNRTLMDDHQLELCEALSGQYCLSCPEEDVVATLRNAVNLFMQVDCRLPPHLTTTAFVKQLDTMLRT